MLRTVYTFKVKLRFTIRKLHQANPSNRILTYYTESLYNLKTPQAYSPFTKFEWDKQHTLLYLFDGNTTVIFHPGK